jgi:predicted ribosome quality control (RQC) complex YloA/Tae2 family protein
MIPFDSLVLAAVCREVEGEAGAFVSKAWQVDEYTIVITIGRKASGRHLLISCDPQLPRLHFVMLPPADVLGAFSGLLKERLEGARFLGIEQVGFDRVARLKFAKGTELSVLAELTGTRSNISLFDSGRSFRLRKLAPREVTPPSPDLESALASGLGLSKFLAAELAEIGPAKLTDLASKNEPVWFPGIGAYPYHPAQLRDQRGVPMVSISAALEKHFAGAESRGLQERLRTTLERALKSKLETIQRLRQALDRAAEAPRMQMFGELVLAHQREIAHGAAHLSTVDYDGNSVVIELNPELTAVENSNSYFAAAKKAKRSAGEVSERIETVEAEAAQLGAMIERIPTHLSEVETWARAHKHFREPTIKGEEKPPRKYDGHKIRETTTPEGFLVLWGENASANDYLTNRVAKPNDYWLHVRGAGGSHVLLQTKNKPTAIQMDTLRFAAAIAARHSGQKHARHVPVSYTLAKYVRKPRKAAPGAVIISNDKTLFVDP